MDKKLANEIIACFAGNRWLFNYFRDRYAFLLTAWALSGRIKLDNEVLKQLRHKPRLKQWFADRGDLKVKSDELVNAWCEDAEPFVLSLGCWEGEDMGWDQVSRYGTNLVLRIGLNNRHLSSLKRLVRPVHDEMFQYDCHPVLQKNEPWPFRNTLSWVRIDLDLNTNEALIEEIQTDWIRLVKRSAKVLGSNRGQWVQNQIKGNPETVQRFCDEIVEPLARIWDEASLAAALYFLVEEVGIGRVYYHTFESGCLIKRLKYSRPPRSLYTRLPRRFGMSMVNTPPEFLASDRRFKKLTRKVSETHWFTMEA